MTQGSVLSRYFAQLRPVFQKSIAGQSRVFSWFSRLNKNPEDRVRKVEALNRRYTLRRLGKLPDESPKLLPGETVFLKCHEDIRKRLEDLKARIGRLANISSVPRSDLEETIVGENHHVKDYVRTTLQPNPRTAILVVREKGYTELVLKSLKAKHGNYLFSIMDRERIQVSLPRITDEFRKFRGKLVDKEAAKVKKELEKLELQCVQDLESSATKSPEWFRWKERIEIEIKNAQLIVQSLLENALEILDLEIDE